MVLLIKKAIGIMCGIIPKFLRQLLLCNKALN